MWLLTLTRNCDKEVTNLNRRINKQPKEEKSMIGKIIDLPMEDFERELVEQKVNIGTMNNLILNLEAIYFDLRNRKDVILNSIFEGRLEKDNKAFIVWNDKKDNSPKILITKRASA